MSTMVVLIVIVMLIALGPIVHSVLGPRLKADAPPDSRPLRTCQRCAFLNPSKAVYCARCGEKLTG